MIEIFANILSVIQNVLSVIQDFKTKKSEKKEKQQYREKVEIEVRRFLSEYHGSIGLLPLCAIAFSYDKNRNYHRKMYSDFRLLPKDVRSEIFKQYGWKMCDVQTDDFYGDCLKCLETATSMLFPKENFNSLFYERAKLVEQSIKCYGQQKCSYSHLFYTDKLSKIIETAVEDGNYNGCTFEKIKRECMWENREDKEICSRNIVCLTASAIAMRTRDKFLPNEKNSNFGSPGSWSGESIETMEDLFLLTLFDIWSNIWDLKEKT